MGYVLMQAKRPLVIESMAHKKKLKDQGVSSFFIETRYIVKGLRDLLWMLTCRRVKVFTDLDNSQQRFSRMSSHKEPDMRVLRFFVL